MKKYKNECWCLYPLPSMAPTRLVTLVSCPFLQNYQGYTVYKKFQIDGRQRAASALLTVQLVLKKSVRRGVFVNKQNGFLE